MMKKIERKALSVARQKRGQQSASLIFSLLIAFFISLTFFSFSAEKKVYEKGYLEERSGILVLHLKGSPYEMGYQHGMLTKHLMGKSKEAFDEAIPPIKGGRIGEWIVRRYLFWKLGKMEKHVPEEFIEELKGMADSITEKKVNYREILLYHAMRDIGQVLMCSSFVALPQATKNRKLIYGRNFDFLQGGSLENVVTFYEPDKGNSFVSIVWPGMIGIVSGMNDKGLTVGILTAYSKDVSFDGIPSCFLMRKVLQYANNIEEAEGIIIQSKRTGPNIILLADEKGAFIIECSATKHALRKPQDGLLCSSNHFLSAIYEKDRKRRKALETGDSQARYKRMEQLLKENSGQIDVEYGIKILRDDLLLKKNTLHSVIFLPPTLEFLIAQGPSVRGKFIRFSLRKENK
jgi:isopenicillin-N N-acyltransferase-like protein